jgi:phosphatidylethanolamine/phosphatidyl-N-methylethanolamine N-methyltransferase
VPLDNRNRYGRIAWLYDLLDAPFERRYRPGRALIGAASKGLILELGAGTGKNFPYYGHSARVIASDLSWQMLVQAARRVRPSIRALLVTDAARLPLGDASLDTVVATFVCCVQDDPGPALREIARVLRPGGQALFMEFALPARGWERWLMRALEPFLHSLYGVHWAYDLPSLLLAPGLDMREVRVVWPPIIHVFVAAKPPDR